MAEEVKEEYIVKHEETKKVEEPKAQLKPFDGLLGRKVGMTQIFDNEGNVIPVTVVEAGPCIVVQKKTIENDGYQALQLGFGRGKNLKKPVLGHLSKVNPEYAPRYLREIRSPLSENFEIGEEIKVDIFKQGELVDVIGTSIGKGFAGTVKRYHFNRGPMSHGSKSHRIPGSIGSGTTPGRVYKGKKLPGRMGGCRVNVQNLQVVEVDPVKNIILIKGAVPGKKNNLLLIRKAK